jgi:hypothetical protein
MAQAQRQEAANDEDETSFSKRKPVFEARHGNVKVAVWENEGASGKFYSASTPTISYKDDAGNWREGSSFGRHDLLDLAEAASEGATKIRDLTKSRAESVAR